MNKILTSLLVLAATTFVAGARDINARTFDEMDRTADVIVVANAKSNDETPLRFAESVLDEDIADLLRQHGGIE